MLDLIGAYENYLTKVKQASANTVASYMRDIRQFSDWLRQEEDLDVVDAEQLNISNYLSHLEEDGRSGATVSRSLASLKNFYAYLVTSGFLEKTPVTEIRVTRGEKKLPQIPPAARSNCCWLSRSVWMPRVTVTRLCWRSCMPPVSASLS